MITLTGKEGIEENKRSGIRSSPFPEPPGE